MKNLHLLATGKPSRLIVYSLALNEFRLLTEPITDWKHKRHVYITNDEALTNDDWCIDKYNQIWKVENHKLVAFDNNDIKRFSSDNVSCHECCKIILTTDQDLIKDGVQAIDDEFLEWFVKNPSCEEVEVRKQGTKVKHHQVGFSLRYFIAIPKEVSELAQEQTIDTVSVSEHRFRKLCKIEPRQEMRKVCKCKRAYENPLSEICSLCWNELYPNEKDEIKDEDLLEPHIKIAAHKHSDVTTESEQSASLESRLQSAIALLKQTTEYEVLDSFKEKVKQLEIE